MQHLYAISDGPRFLLWYIRKNLNVFMYMIMYIYEINYSKDVHIWDILASLYALTDL